ncbi:SDR family NAD(P)-dependent oxidoreductase [Halobellus rubicundus]|uniref:SDR family NAD(P)-dependent oxidoreductase n=1 Tax=Halobellus rubicundus TaxID=2996466 RepID=A0ABD5MHI3_9EURY
MYDLDGETAIVTGAAQGFGKAIAELLAEAGANVVLADVQMEKAEDVAAGIRDDGGEAMVVECDVTDVDHTDALVEQTCDRYGSLEVLVNNAGGGGGGTFTDLSPEEWRRVVSLNLDGTFNCSYSAVPKMLEHGNGRIVNISSMAGRNVTLNGNANYTASKWGVIGLSKHLARDLGPDVRANAVCPGGGPDSPMGRGIQAEDVAKTVLYLSTEISSFVTGTLVEVDGGGQLTPSASN